MFDFIVMIAWADFLLLRNCFWRKRRHAGEADDRFAAGGAKFHRLQNA
jgi:hypothetical protein